MSERPYIPQGTPITVTIDGYWDGMHNGNEPYMSYPGPGDTTKKVYIPHGAYVETKPEQTEKVEFVVDKTPKPPEKCLSMWYGYRCGEPQGHAGKHKAPQGFEFGPLTDVTDTGEPLPEQCDDCESTGRNCRAHKVDGWDYNNPGEPLDTETDYVPMSYEEAEYWGRMDDYDEKKDNPRKPEPCGYDGYDIDSCQTQWHVHTPHSQPYDTPRKPEPGDRVRVKTPNGNTFEGMYVTEYRAGKDQVSVVEDDCILTVTGHPKDLVWEVIEPARPVVPEEPDSVSVVEDKEGVFWLRLAVDRGYCWESPDPRFDPVGWEDLWDERGPLVSYERGPVIGG